MPRLELIDTSVRDGNQSLWGATGLNTAMMLGAAPIMDRVGFAAIDFTTSTHMAVAARFQRENPWERIRLMRAAMPRTPLGFLTTGMRFISWEIAHADLMRLAFGLLVEAGIRRFAIMDPMNDADSMIAMARLARDAGVDRCAYEDGSRARGPQGVHDGNGPGPGGAPQQRDGDQLWRVGSSR